MAFTWGSDSCGYGGAAASASTIATVQTITVAVHDTIFAWFMVTGVRTFTVTDNFSNIYSLVGSVITESSSGNCAALYVCRDSNSSGACSVTVTINAAATNRSMCIGCITGLSNSATATTDGGANPVMTAGADAVTTTSTAPTTQPAIVLGFQWNAYNITTSIGTGFTQAPEQALGNTKGTYFGGEYILVEYKRVTSTSATPATFTSAGSVNGCAVIELIIPESGASVTSPVIYSSADGYVSATLPTIKTYRA